MLRALALAILAGSLGCDGAAPGSLGASDGAVDNDAGGLPGSGGGGPSDGSVGPDAAGGRGGASGSGGQLDGGSDGPDGGGAGGGLGSGGATGTGGRPGSGGAPGSGGRTGSGGVVGSGGGGGALPAITVWIAGDSTVATGGSACPNGWGGVFAPHFDNRVTVTNSAVGGRSVRTWLYSVQKTMDSTGECVLDRDGSNNPLLQARWQAMLDGMKTGHYLFIQFGINDGSATCDRHVGLAAFKESYGMMAQAAKARGANPVFVTPVSSISCRGTTAVGTRGEYVTATKEAGVEYGVPVIDLHELSVALFNRLALCPIPGGGDVTATTGGAVGAFFCEDHTHFERAGATQIAELIVQALRDQGIGLAAYLK